MDTVFLWVCVFRELYINGVHPVHLTIMTVLETKNDEKEKKWGAAAFSRGIEIMPTSRPIFGVFHIGGFNAG